MFLYMGDPPRDGIAEVLRCDSSSLALSLEEPEATLIDYTIPIRVPSRSIFVWRSLDINL